MEKSDSAKMNRMSESEMIQAFIGSRAGRRGLVEFTRSKVVKRMSIDMEIIIRVSVSNGNVEFLISQECFRDFREVLVGDVFFKSILHSVGAQ